MKKHPEIEDEIKRLAFQKFGWPGLISVAIVSLLLLIWWQWEHVKTVPGLGPIVRWIEQESIPLAEPTKFSIAVSHLQGDLEGNPHERLVVEALKEVYGIEILRFDRTIDLEDSPPQQSEEAGHKRAQEYLQESGADILIWGSVLSAGEKAILKLHWTINGKPLEGWRRYQPTENLNLPELFWGDLSTLLIFLVAAHHEEYKHGSFVVDNASAQIPKVRKLLEDKGHSWKTEFRLVLKLLLALSLSIVGEQANTSDSLREAAQVYRDALKEISLAQNPQLWSWIQNNLGLALLQLSGHKTGTKEVSDAIAAFQEALQARKRDRVPLEWARTQSNLAHATQTLGERTGDAKQIEDATKMLRLALEIQNQQNAHSDWASTQNRLAAALLHLGEHQNQIERIKEAEQAVREALKEWTPGSVSRMWAGAQINLGNILQALGTRLGDTKRLQEAAEAYQAAQRYFSRNRSPLDWALAQNNLGNTLKVLGEREGSTKRLKESIQVLQESLEERTKEVVPVDWARTQSNLGLALTSLAMREEGTTSFHQAIRAHRMALEVLQPQHMPADWARTQFNLGIALRALGVREGNPKIVCDALQAYFSVWDFSSDSNNTSITPMAMKEVASTIQNLEKQFSSQEASRCLSGITRGTTRPKTSLWGLT